MIGVASRAAGVLLAPVPPSPAQARDDVGRELLRPEYGDRNVIEQVLGWLGDRLGDLIDATSRAPAVSTFFALVLLLVLVLALVLLAGRARRLPRAARGPGPVLTDEVVGAAELRRRAEEAQSQGRWGAAALDAFRALTTAQIEGGALDDVADATAREVAVALGARHPEHSHALSRAATIFDEVRYGSRPAAPEAVTMILALDEALRESRTSAAV